MAVAWSIERTTACEVSSIALTVVCVTISLDTCVSLNNGNQARKVVRATPYFLAMADALPLVLYSCTASIFSSSVSGFFRHFFFIDYQLILRGAFFAHYNSRYNCSANVHYNPDSCDMAGENSDNSAILSDNSALMELASFCTFGENNMICSEHY